VKAEDRLLPRPRKGSIEESYRKEKERLERELGEWKEYYQRHRSQMEAIVGYKARIRELEAELEKKKAILGEDFERNRNFLLFSTLFLVLATVLIIRILSWSGNVWLFLVVGFALGFSWGVLIKIWLSYR
jgi:Flp pilus assembly protein TadB